MRKKCLLHGYFAQNFGDDLIIHTLCERYPETDFFVTVASADEIVPQLSNIHVIKTDSPFGLIKKTLLNFDAQIYAGGSIFQQNKWWRENLKSFSRGLSIPTFVLGASFGPVKDENMCSCYRPLFNRCADVAFRDSYSTSLFDDVKTVRCSYDMAEYYTYSPVPQENKKILISVISGENPSSAYSLVDYEASIAKWCNQLSDSGFSVTLAALCPQEGDEKAAANIARLSGSNPGIISFNGDINAMLKAIGNAEYVIATRFHAALTSMKMSKKVLPVIYHEKQTNYFNFSQCIYADSLKGDIMELLSESKVPARIKNHNESSLFEKLDKLLLHKEVEQ